MKITYKNTTAEKQFASKHKKTWRYPKDVQTKLQAAENYIKQAETLLDIVNYRPFKFHQLKGDRKGEWSIYLGNTGYRVTLLPCDEQSEPIIDGDVIAQCKSIRIIMVTEVSNHYE